MSHLNVVRNEMESLLGSITIDTKARSLLLFLRSSEIGLLDCLKIAKQMQDVIIKDSEFEQEDKIESPTKLSAEFIKTLNLSKKSPLNRKSLDWPSLTEPKEPA
ncbi:MAG: hypothetical protein H8D97_00065 [Proteobacteria bacterium]|nr:hypothetical protein [Pseudomonadota bacterium]